MVVTFGVIVIFVISWTVRAAELPTVKSTEPTTLLTLLVPSSASTANAVSTANAMSTANMGVDLVQDLQRESGFEPTEALLLATSTSTSTSTSANNDDDDEAKQHHTCVAHAKAAWGLWHRFCGNPLVLILPQCWIRAPSVERCCTKGKEPPRSCSAFLPAKERGGVA